MGLFDFLKKNNDENIQSNQLNNINNDNVDNLSNLNDTNLNNSNNMDNTKDFKTNLTKADEAIFSNININNNNNNNLNSAYSDKIKDDIVLNNSSFENKFKNNSFDYLNNQNNNSENNFNKDNLSQKNITPSFSNFDNNFNNLSNNKEETNEKNDNDPKLTQHLIKSDIDHNNFGVNYNIPFPDNSNDDENKRYLEEQFKNQVLEKLKNPNTPYDFSNNTKEGINLSPDVLNSIKNSFIEPNTKLNKESVKEIDLTGLQTNEEKELFMSILDFKNLFNLIDSINQDTKNASNSVLRTIEINNDLDLVYQNWKKNFDEIDNKIDDFEKILFN
jgi:hypothetical protein